VDDLRRHCARIGLAAATGFRVFVPLLIAGLAARFGELPLSEHFQWLASAPALVMLGTAAAAEILAYYIRASITCST